MSFLSKTIRSPRRIALAISLGVYSVLWLGGVSQHLSGGPARKEHDWLASLFLVLAGFIVLLAVDATRELTGLLAIAVFGFVIEVIGVRSGFPFGFYSYTPVLQPQLFGVPIMMAFAWMVLLAGVKQTLQGLALAPWLETLLGALWMTAIDLVIDPLAANLLGYWQWLIKGDYFGIPAINFAGWFLSSLLVFGVLNVLAVSWKPNDWNRWISVSIVLFFSLIAFANQLILISLIGFALSGMQILLGRIAVKRKEVARCHSG